jgi:hypothetical protein
MNIWFYLWFRYRNCSKSVRNNLSSPSCVVTRFEEESYTRARAHTHTHKHTQTHTVTRLEEESYIYTHTKHVHT